MWGAFSHTFAVPPGTHATVLYALVNTAWGQVFQNQGRIIVTGTGGETATLFLTEGFNLRDHDNRNFVNTLSRRVSRAHLFFEWRADHAVQPVPPRPPGVAAARSLRGRYDRLDHI